MLPDHSDACWRTTLTVTNHDPGGHPTTHAVTGAQLHALAQAVHAGQDPATWLPIVGAQGFSSRVMDRALQWLRKASIIQYSNRKWVGVP